MLDENTIKSLTIKAAEIRMMTLDAIGYLGVGHVGGCMSLVEILTLLYYRHMQIDPKNPKKRDRDQLIVSKGHAGPTLYSILADKGFFPVEKLHTLNQGGTDLPSHCDKNLTPGIDMTTGSLGQGLSAAIGIALGNRIDGIDSKIFVIVGDGECNEGQVWEAAQAAAQFKLNHLIAFTDYNKLQLDGFMQDIMSIEDIEAKWTSFGWFVQRVNGHDFAEMDRAIEHAKNEPFRPSMIILDTIKGKGVSFAENEVANHNMKLDFKTAQDVIAKIKKELGALDE